MKVAVYGTLKKGYGNHVVLGNQAKLVGVGNTVGFYNMLNAGYPAIQRDEENGKPVRVEVYEVPEEQMGPLDRLEGVPYLYTREKDTIKVFDGPEEEIFLDEVWIYVGTDRFKGHQDYPQSNPDAPVLVWDGYKQNLPKTGRFD